jgi:hypothetical protein
MQENPFSKYVWAGVLFVISSVFNSIFAALGEDLYNISKALIQTQPIPIELIISIVFGVIGVGLIVYDILHRRSKSKQKQIQKREDDEEDKWNYFPSNVP